MLADQMLKDAILAWIENAQKKACKSRLYMTNHQ
jgi:hypothetical protein